MFWRHCGFKPATERCPDVTLNKHDCGPIKGVGHCGLGLFITLTNRHLIKRSGPTKQLHKVRLCHSLNSISSETQINERIAPLIFIIITSTAGNDAQSRTNLKAGSRILDKGPFRSMFGNENH